ncbi:MAG: FecR domain-containing protein [Gammaproteobacteria bacterium]
MRDGSAITLNTDSQLRVALTEAERRVDLKQGEAFFEVAKDSTRPFVVEAGRKRVVAVGTKFSVRRDGDFVEVVDRGQGAGGGCDASATQRGGRGVGVRGA